MMLDALEHETGPQPQRCLIILHGLGADGSDFEPVCQMLARGLGLLLGPHEGIMKASLGGLEIHDLAFAYTARRGLAYAQNFDGPIGPGLANDETDL